MHFDLQAVCTLFVDALTSDFYCSGFDIGTAPFDFCMQESFALQPSSLLDRGDLNFFALPIHWEDAARRNEMHKMAIFDSESYIKPA